MKLKPGVRKIGLLLVVLIGLTLALFVRHAYLNGWLPGTKPMEVAVPKAVKLGKEGKSAVNASIPILPLPKAQTAAIEGPAVTFKVWAWNAQMGLMLANGGPDTTQGSLMEKYGVKLHLERQDDTNVMQSDLIAFAKELKNGNQQPDGTHFIAIMGDGGAQFFAAINHELEKLGPEYHAEVVGSAGYSRGEDGFWGPLEWKTNPQAARGGVVAGVLKDGDWNIGMDWDNLNGIPNNPDPKTYREDAMNWIAANDYIDAATKYISGYSEERDIVDVQGHRTGKKKTITVQAVVTWTPGDVNIAQQKGGLVRLLSTKENRMQMPNVIIGVHKWDSANTDKVKGMLRAIFEAGDQIKISEAALKKAAEVSAAVYKENDAAYWVKYYKGSKEKDKTGNLVELGGSTVNNLADNLYLFGIDGGENPLKITYTTFGDIVKQQYPNDVPTYPAYEKVVDATYLFALKQEGSTSSGEADVATFSGNETITDTVGNRAWNIEFATDSAAFTPAANKTLKELASTLSISSGTIVQIEGHTDSTGNPQHNQELSERRAEAVKTWLLTQGARTFPSDRIHTKGLGGTQPIADNTSKAGQARNRRVQIILGTSD